MTFNERYIKSTLNIVSTIALWGIPIVVFFIAIDCYFIPQKHFLSAAFGGLIGALTGLAFDIWITDQRRKDETISIIDRLIKDLSFDSESVQSYRNQNKIQERVCCLSQITKTVQNITDANELTIYLRTIEKNETLMQTLYNQIYIISLFDKKAFNELPELYFMIFKNHEKLNEKILYNSVWLRNYYEQISHTILDIRKISETVCNKHPNPETIKLLSSYYENLECYLERADKKIKETKKMLEKYKELSQTKFPEKKTIKFTIQDPKRD